jgi:DNA repair protein RadC
MIGGTKPALKVRSKTLLHRAPPSATTTPAATSTSEDVYRLLHALNATQRVTESFCVLLLDSRQKLLGIHECARGGVANVPIEVQEVFRVAIVVGARAILLAHNHPSGECSPSPEDVAFTARVQEASALLGIPLLDHVVVAENGYYSFADAGDLLTRTARPTPFDRTFGCAVSVSSV